MNWEDFYQEVADYACEVPEQTFDFDIDSFRKLMQTTYEYFSAACKERRQGGNNGEVVFSSDECAVVANILSYSNLEQFVSIYGYIDNSLLRASFFAAYALYEKIVIISDSENSFPDDCVLRRPFPYLGRNGEDLEFTYDMKTGDLSGIIECMHESKIN